MAACVMALSNAEIIDLLTTATTDLLWISETDAPFEVLLLEGGKSTKPTPKKLLKWLAQPPEAEIKTQEVDAFFAPVLEAQDWHEAEEKENIRRYENLLASLKEHLTDLQVYRFGNSEFTICIVGRTSDGQWVGLKTIGVET